jgi:hypothetical protein
MYYKILEELPSIPDDMLNATLRYESDSDDPFVNNPKTTYNQRKIIRDNKIEQNKLFNKQSLTPELLEWIKKNITDKFTGASLAKTFHVDGATLAPHVDRTRKFTLIYLLESGGSEHKTIFYSAKDHCGNYKPGEQFEYSEVEEVDSITIPLYKWTILDAGVPHSVENIPDMRVAIQLGLEINPWTTM